MLHKLFGSMLLINSQKLSNISAENYSKIVNEFNRNFAHYVYWIETIQTD